MSHFTATYSPEDNKLRLYASSRLDAELYARVKNAGFRFAPKQDLFVAPMWTPERENLLIELCGGIGDEDTSLVDRAAERADRFEDYSDSRTREGEAAYAAVQNITEHMPLGQPILVGHHSERHARKDAERITSGMRRAVNAWETADYWKRRAAGALAHAKYKERPDVRHRRIKGLEADARKYNKEIDNANKFTKLWSKEGLTVELALRIAGYDYVYVKQEGEQRNATVYDLLNAGNMDALQASQVAIAAHARTIAHYERWLAHAENRIAYERAMLEESGGIAADKFEVGVGGRVLIGDEWLVVLRVNRSMGRINSVTTSAPRHVTWCASWKSPIEEVKDYRAPEAADVAAAEKKAKLAPLVNFPGDGFIEMTKTEWNARNDDHKSVRKIAATADHSAYRVRRALVPNEGYKLKQVYLTDSKRVDRPAVGNAEPVTIERQVEPRTAEPVEPKPDSQEQQRAKLDQLREHLRDGVKVVSAPQLFPTPATLAGRMVDEAQIQPGDRVGEFSAGTGRILSAVSEAIDFAAISVTAVEINSELSRTLQDRFPAARVICADFLSCGADLGKFQKIIINPPFANAQDIAHILHALPLLDDGGRLVAVCANGPRQQEKLRPLVESRGGLWEELPDDTFEESGTRVRTVLLTIDN